MENSTVISVRSVTKYFGKVTGVKEISFTVEKGDIFGFLGPNGSGKTTTIRLLLDLLRPDNGTIKVFGKNLQNNSFEIRQKCGYLPGNFSAYGNLTGNQFLNLLSNFRKVKNFSPPRLYERLGISEFDLKRKIKHLSHGTLQKLGIIQAFWCYPELLILDEPTIGLDPLMQNVFYDLLKEYQEKGITIFLSSHNLSEVERICHRVAIIRKGEIIKTESISNLKKMLNRKLFLTLKQPLDSVELPGAKLISRQELKFEFEVTGDFELLLRRLSELPVSDIVLPEPDLQEIFMNYYNGKSDE
jgi:ABC-2 type transport system ATP-binding protein